MSLIAEMEEWKADLEDLAVEKGKAEGRLEQAKERLKEVGYDSIEDATAALETLKAELEEAEQEARRLMEVFSDKYKAFIE